MFKQSFITFTVAVALTTACNSRNVSTDAGPRPQDSATAGARTNTALSVQDQQFAEKAAAGGRTEVELGRLAQEHASSDVVKQLGQRIADDHERANRELESMLGASDVARTAAPSENDDTRSRLEKMSGAEFDRAYVEQMIDDHQKDITEFQRAAESRNPKVRSFAEKTLPTLRQHLQLARDAQTSLSK